MPTLYESTAVGWSPDKQKEFRKTAVRRTEHEAGKAAMDGLHRMRVNTGVNKSTIEVTRTVKYTLSEWPDGIDPDEMPDGYDMSGVLESCKGNARGVESVVEDETVVY